MDSAYPILFKGKYNREAQVINGQTTSPSLDGILNYLFLPWGSLHLIDDLYLSVIAPPLMEKKICDDLIGDKIQINKQTSNKWRFLSELNPILIWLIDFLM